MRYIEFSSRKKFLMFSRTGLIYKALSQNIRMSVLKIGK